MSFVIQDSKLVIQFPDVVLKAIDAGFVHAEIHLSKGGHVDARFRFASNVTKSLSLVECQEFFRDTFDGRDLTKDVVDKWVSVSKGKIKQSIETEAALVQQLEEVLLQEENDSDSDDSYAVVSYKQAKKRCEVRNLHQHRIQGVLNAYSLDSLSDNDFKRENNLDFVARVVVVAHNISADVAENKIRSLFSVNDMSVAEWWSQASVTDRVRMLTNSRKFKGNVSADRLQRIGYVANPFNA